MSVETSMNKGSVLADRWAELKAGQPQLRIRNAATDLNTSEAELLSTITDGSVTRLRPEFQAILKEIASLGKVMALTRNDDVVHERKGVYLNPELENKHVGLFVGEDIDLRIFFSCWKYAFAVKEGEGEKARYSLQFFASDGEAVHKIYMTNQSNHDAYSSLVTLFTSDEQGFIDDVAPWNENNVILADSEIDIPAFREEWLAMKDPHQFFGILKKYGLQRTQALRLGPEGNFAVRVNNEALRTVISKAAEDKVPVMVFVGNKGMIQIHTGPVVKHMEMNGWYNVLDPDFNLHVKEESIVESWVVRKPAEGAIVTALECYDKNGKQVIQLFGKRKPGIPELEEWKRIIAETEHEARI